MSKSKMIYIYIDDTRACPDQLQNSYPVFIARDYYGAIDVICFCEANDIPFFVDFDHDLGEGKSGYDIAKYIVENQIQIVGYDIHSMNPVGRANIEQLLSHYGYRRVPMW